MAEKKGKVSTTQPGLQASLDTELSNTEKEGSSKKKKKKSEGTESTTQPG